MKPVDFAEAEFLHLEGVVASIKRGDRFIFWRLWPFVLLRFFGFLGRGFQAWFVRRYFRAYFRLKGVSGYDSLRELPTKLTRPTLILGARYHDMSPLYVYQLFRFPVVVPLRRIFRDRFFKTMSYSDAPLLSNLDNIRQMLEAGHCVFAHLNHGLWDERDARSLFVYRALESVLSWNVDIYFLCVSGFENYKFSSHTNPILVSHTLVPLSGLLPGSSDRKGPALFKKLAKFFGTNQVFAVGRGVDEGSS